MIFSLLFLLFFYCLYSNMTPQLQDKAVSNQTSWLAWIELACVVLLNMSINLRWLTFSPVASLSAQYLNVNISAITWLSNCATLIYIAICVSTGWVFEKYGMKTCVSHFLHRHIMTWTLMACVVLVFVGCRYQHFRLLDQIFRHICTHQSALSSHHVWTGTHSILQSKD